MIYKVPQKEELGVIQGKLAGSKHEWWTAQALWRYDIQFMYQFEIFGGRDVRGGLILDFLVWNPMATPLPVHGEYWHREELSGGDQTALIAIADYFNMAVDDIPILWASDSQTEEDVFAFVRRKIAK